MAQIGIVRERSIDEIVFSGSGPKLIFGVNGAPSQKKERKSIGHALVKTGLEVYATNTLWPNDSYILNNGLVIAGMYFGDLAHGGNYIFGDGFVLVSSAIKDGLEKKLKDSEPFREFFSGSEVIFIPPYAGSIEGIDGFKLKPRHLDLTAGYVPSAKLLSIGERHYTQEKKLFEELKKRFGISIQITKRDNFYPNNFFVLEYKGKTYVVANRLNNPFEDRDPKLRVTETDKEIINLPGKFGGSVKCAVNMSPTTGLWDRLGIEYRRWGINPNYVNNAMR